MLGRKSILKIARKVAKQVKWVESQVLPQSLGPSTWLEALSHPRHKSTKCRPSQRQDVFIQQLQLKYKRKQDVYVMLHCSASIHPPNLPQHWRKAGPTRDLKCSANFEALMETCKPSRGRRQSFAVLLEVGAISDFPFS